MGEKLRKLRLGRWLILPPVLIGAGIFGYMLKSRPPLPREPISELARPLRVIEVSQVALVPRVIGYGTAEPGDVWRAVAEVKGRVVSVHPELKSGVIVRKGDEVLRIDPADYELQIALLRAETAQVASQLAELDALLENYHNSLKIEKASLALAQRNLRRLRSLQSGGSVTDAEIDSQERETLAQHQSVQSLNNSLHRLPAQREALNALIAAKQASLKLSELDLSRTIITAPFDCRLGQLSIEEGQFLAVGEMLFEAHGTQLTEIEAKFPLDQIRTLLTSDGRPMDTTVDAMQEMRKIFNVDVIVRLRSGDFVVQWPGRFDRVREQLDIQTRSVRIVVAVDKPYENVIPGERPPLAPGMFCEVELRGQPRTGQIVIPRVALHDGHAYVLSDLNRLVRRAVKIDFSQGNLVCLQEGLQPGERLVISDPVPAIEGMLVEPVPDEESAQTLFDEASGAGSVR